MLKRSHYENELENLHIDKDSIFEVCTILNYDSKTMLASIHTLQSNQLKTNVPVLFSSFFLNSGVVSPPVKQSTAIMFWGPEKSCYVFPAQFFPFVQKRIEGQLTFDASPTMVDPSFSYEHVNGGEHFIRSLGGAYLHVKNNQEIVLSNPFFQSFTIGPSGISVLSDKETRRVGGLQSYVGLVDNQSQDQHLKLMISDSIQTDVIDDLLTASDEEGKENQLLDLAVSGYKEFVSKEHTNDVLLNPPIIEIQAGNVYDSHVKQQSSIVDQDADLAVRFQIKNQSGDVLNHVEIDKEGNMFSKLENETHRTEVIVLPGRLEFVFTKLDEPLNSPNRTIKQSFGYTL